MSTPSPRQPPQAPPKPPTTPRPSASVLLVSPTNQILLLHRVNKASSFPSAHVFPGGALSSTHDGAIPPPTSPTHHEDGPAYRLAAVRETFEECGILLATSKNTGQLFTDISDTEREEGRRAVHSGKLRFPELLEKWGAVPDTQRLIPFTRWITPPSMPKRFSTQMYLYFLPPSSASPSSSPGPDELVIPAPTHDGGIEHTAARFLPPATWLHLARTNQVLFPTPVLPPAPLVSLSVRNHHHHHHASFPHPRTHSPALLSPRPALLRRYRRTHLGRRLHLPHYARQRRVRRRKPG